MPGAEDAPARVLRVRRRRAAQHADLDRRRRAARGRRPSRARAVDGVVLGVEEGVVLDRDVADAAVAIDADRAEVDVAVARKSSRPRERLGLRLRHRVHQVRRRPRVRPAHARANMPWSISRPALSFWSCSRSASIVRRGSGAGRDSARPPRTTRLAHPQRPRSRPSVSVVVDRVDALVQTLVASRPLRSVRHAPPTLDSTPAQYGSRSSRLSTLPAPDFGSGSSRSSIRLGTL